MLTLLGACVLIGSYIMQLPRYKKKRDAAVPIAIAVGATVFVGSIILIIVGALLPSHWVVDHQVALASGTTADGQTYYALINERPEQATYTYLTPGSPVNKSHTLDTNDPVLTVVRADSPRIKVVERYVPKVFGNQWLFFNLPEDRHIFYLRPGDAIYLH